MHWKADEIKSSTNGGKSQLSRIVDDIGLAIDFRALFESSPTPLLVVCPPDFTIAAVNDAYLCVTMTRREEILGRGLFEVFPEHPDDPGADSVGHLRVSLERVLVTRRADTMAVQKWYLRRPVSRGGVFEERYWRPINAPVPGPNGEVACIIHRLEDVSEITRLRAANQEAARIEAKLCESRAEIERQARLYDTALSSISDFAYIFDREGRFVYANKPLLELWGLTFEDVVGKNFFDLQYPDYLAVRLQWQIQQVFETRQGLTDETPYTSPTRESGYYEYIFRPVFGADGSVEVVAGSTRDITGRKRSEEALRKSEQRFRALSECLERRVETRTAELQQQAVRLRRLAGDLTSAEQRERKRLAAILHDGLQQLLVAAKMRLGQARSQIRDPAVIATIENVTDLLCQAVDSSRNLTLQLRPPALYEGGLMPALRWLASELPKLYELHVVIDAEDAEPALSDDVKALLFESVRELLFNVTKHAGVNQAIVRVRRDGQWLRIVVEDEGIGFNVDAVLQEKDLRQTGIGLFSIRERLAALDGDMVVEQLATSGTRVQLRVPLVLPSGEKPVVQAERLGPVATRSQPAHAATTDCQARVLVVDDHAIVREGIANVLGGDERLLVVGEAADGVEAIQAMERHQPDVVVIDVNMPRMNGVEATREIRRRWPDVRIVALSVQDDAATARTMLRVGADTFVSKSDAPDRMIHAVLAL